MFNEQSMPKSLKCAVFRIDLISNYIVSCDGNFLDIMGYTNQEIKNQMISLETIIDKRDYSFVFSTLKNSIQSRKLLGCSSRMSHKQGMEIKSLLYIETGEEYADIILHDVSEAKSDISYDVAKLKLVQENLAEVSLQMDTLMSNIPGGVATFILDAGYLKLLYANNEYYGLLGYSKMQYHEEPDKIIGKFLYENDCHIISKDLDNPVTDDRLIKYEVRVHTKERGLLWISVRARFLKYMDGKPVYYVIIWDIEDRKEMEYEMKIQAERYKLIEEITDEFQFEYDVRSDTVILPKKKAKSLDDPSVINKFYCCNKMEKIICKEHLKMVKETLEYAISNDEKGVLEFKARIYENSFKWYRLYFVSISGEGGLVERVVGRIKNIDEEKSHQDKLEQRLKSDPLTNLLNKVAIKYSIDNYLSKGKSDSCHAMLLIDIDNFKCVNDTLGHIMGDNTILDIADNMKSVFRATDLLGRVGGDEFLVFMKNVNKDAVKERARELCCRIKQVYKNNETEVNVSCSIGIAYYPFDGEEYNEMFSKADLAMYYAKVKGGNHFASYEEIIENI